MELSAKRKAFCDAYLANGFNATKAAIEAGYSEKTAKSQGNRLLTFVDVQEYIKRRTDALMKERIATGDEILAFLSDVMCGRLEETRFDRNGNAIGYVSQKNQLKAAETLAKCSGLMVQKVEVSADIPKAEADIAAKIAARRKKDG